MRQPSRNIEGFVLKQTSNISGVNSLPATLKDVSYDGHILNNILKMNMKQVFQSSSNKDFSESFYEITVQEGACLEHFEAIFEGKKVLGIIKSKKTAKEEYSTAKSQGSLVSYAEIEQKTSSEQLVKVKLGNLPPSSEVEISISYSYQVDALLNSFYVVSIPLIFVEKIENINLKKPVLTLEISCTGAITYCQSKGCLTEIQKIDSNTYKIELNYTNLNNNFPFSLVYGYEGMFEPQVVYGASKAKKDDAVKQSNIQTRESVFVSFLPAFNSEYSPKDWESDNNGNNNEPLSFDHAVASNSIKESIYKCSDIWSDEYQAKVKDELIDHMEVSKSEFIFLLDRSGSMNGSPITKAIQALTLFLQSLPKDSYFNVVSFGSYFSYLFPKSCKYNKESMQLAISTISSYSATFGGTEIFEPLENVLCKQDKIKYYNKQVFLLTDGEVSRPEEVIKLAKQHCKYARIHAIGFGREADKHLIEGTAKAGKGQSRIISLREDLSELIVTMLSGCLTPTLDDFQIEYDTSVFESVFPDPKSLPCILKDEIFNLHLFLRPLVKVSDLTEKQRTIEVSYFDSKKKAQVNQLVKLQTTDALICNESLRETAFKLGKQLQLNQKIEDIEINQRKYISIEKEKLENSIISESVDYQILNKLTALICVINELDDAQISQFNDSKNNVVSSSLPLQTPSFLFPHSLIMNLTSFLNPQQLLVNGPGYDQNQMSMFLQFQQQQQQQNQYPSFGIFPAQPSLLQALSYNSLTGGNPFSQQLTPQIPLASQFNTICSQIQSVACSPPKPSQPGYALPRLQQQVCAPPRQQQEYCFNSQLESKNDYASSSRKRFTLMTSDLDLSSSPKKRIKVSSPQQSVTLSHYNNHEYSLDQTIIKELENECFVISEGAELPNLDCEDNEFGNGNQQILQKQPAHISQPPQTSNKLSLSEILSYVDSDGMWKYNEKICLTYLSADQLQTLKCKFNENIDVFMSIVILAVLDAFFISQKAKWTLIAKKTLSWIKSHLKVHNLQQVQDDILKVIQENI